ncbi:hypothetical protein JTB14_004102 [Gonioctena quinquepunctata]|nr:hypothetical protein JTB14_004102 [Gonioctena quinquepunctata]
MERWQLGVEYETLDDSHYFILKLEKDTGVNDDDDEDLTVAELLVHEIEEDNKIENLEEEENNLQEDIDISEPGPSKTSKRKKRHQ